MKIFWLKSNEIIIPVKIFLKKKNRVQNYTIVHLTTVCIVYKQDLLNIVLESEFFKSFLKQP